jgi:ribonuclease HII
VALASMVSKYTREVMMREFNRFWQQHIPDLKPTAGYPADAARFLDTIRPVLARLGIDERRVWRRK